MNINKVNSREIPSSIIPAAVQTSVQTSNMKNIAKGRFLNFEESNSNPSSDLSFIACQIPNATQMFLPAEDDFILHTFNTTGDGSCGIHAVFGKYSKQRTRADIRVPRFSSELAV